MSRRLAAISVDYYVRLEQGRASLTDVAQSVKNPDVDGFVLDLADDSSGDDGNGDGPLTRLASVSAQPAR